MKKLLISVKCIKTVLQILLLPVYISLTIVQLVVMFVTWLSATVFHILSGIICITAILGYGFGQETGTETIRMLAMLEEYDIEVVVVRRLK